MAGGAQCIAGGRSHLAPTTTVTVWTALCYAESESIDDRFTPAPMRRVAFRAEPAADRAQLGCSPPPHARKMQRQGGQHCSPCTPPWPGSVCGGSAGSMLTPYSATSRGERFALCCGSVHAPVPLR